MILKDPLTYFELLFPGLVPPGRLGQVRQTEEVHDGGEHGAQGTQACGGLESTGDTSLWKTRTLHSVYISDQSNMFITS